MTGKTVFNLGKNLKETEVIPESLLTQAVY